MLQSQRFVDGSSIEIELLRCAIGGRESAFIDVVNEWLSYVEKRFKTPDGKLIQRIAWDCIPRNLVRLTNGKIADFDLEFERDQAFKIEDLCEGLDLLVFGPCGMGSKLLSGSPDITR